MGGGKHMFRKAFMVMLLSAWLLLAMATPAAMAAEGGGLTYNGVSYNDLQSVSEAVTNAQDTNAVVYVSALITLSSDESDANYYGYLNNANITWTRASGFTGSNVAGSGANGTMFLIDDKDAAVTLSDAHINGGWKDADGTIQIKAYGAAIYIKAGNLEITDSTVIENNGNYNTKNSFGGGIFISAITTLGIPAPTFKMSGGTVQNNYCSYYGGGIYATGNGDDSCSALEFTGGTITGNTAAWHGGGIYCASRSLKMETGNTTVTYNKALVGGGIYLACNDTAAKNGGTESFIYSATISHNSACSESILDIGCGYYNEKFASFYRGGGIYVSHNATLHMKNVYGTYNKSHNDGTVYYSTEDGATIEKPESGTAYYRVEASAAVISCPTGAVAVYDEDGALFVDNYYSGGYGEAADFAVISDGTQGIGLSYLSDIAPGGGKITVMDWIQGVETEDQPEADPDYYQYTYDTLSVESIASDQTKTLAASTAARDGVIMQYNESDYGGSAIATNGTLTFGTEMATLSVVKVWDDDGDGVMSEEEKAAHEKDSVVVQLAYNNYDSEGNATVFKISESTMADAVQVLDADNNWSYTWKALGTTQDWTVVEANVPGYTSSFVKSKAEDPKFDYYWVGTLINTYTGNNTSKLTISKTYQADASQEFDFYIKLKNEQWNGDYAFSYYLTDADGTVSDLEFVTDMDSDYQSKVNLRSVAAELAYVYEKTGSGTNELILVFVDIDGNESYYRLLSDSDGSNGLISATNKSSIGGAERICDFTEMEGSIRSIMISKRANGTLSYFAVVTNPDRTTTYIQLETSGVSGDTTADQLVSIMPLTSGQSITIVGIPVGTSYMVAEGERENYHITINGTDSADGIASGIIREEGSSIRLDYVNEKKAADTDETETEVPNTGDTSRLALWIGLMGLSCGGLIVLFLLSRKRYCGDRRDR